MDASKEELAVSTQLSGNLADKRPRYASLYKTVPRGGLIKCWSCFFQISSFIYFYSPPNLGGSLADRHQTLPCSMVTQIYKP